MSVDYQPALARYAPESVREVFQRVTSVTLRGVNHGDSALAALTAFEHIEVISLESTVITPEGLGRLRALPRLKSLQLTGLQVTDETLAELATLPTLEELTLSHTSTTCPALAELRDARPDLAVEYVVTLDEQVERVLAQKTPAFACPTSGTAIR